MWSACDSEKTNTSPKAALDKETERSLETDVAIMLPDETIHLTYGSKHPSIKICAHTSMPLKHKYDSFHAQPRIWTHRNNKLELRTHITHKQEHSPH